MQCVGVLAHEAHIFVKGSWKGEMEYHLLIKIDSILLKWWKAVGLSHLAFFDLALAAIGAGKLFEGCDLGDNKWGLIFNFSSLHIIRAAGGSHCQFLGDKFGGMVSTLCFYMQVELSIVERIIEWLVNKNLWQTTELVYD